MSLQIIKDLTNKLINIDKNKINKIISKKDIKKFEVVIYIFIRHLIIFLFVENIWLNDSDFEKFKNKISYKLYKKYCFTTFELILSFEDILKDLKEDVYLYKNENYNKDIFLNYVNEYCYYLIKDFKKTNIEFYKEYIKNIFNLENVDEIVRMSFKKIKSENKIFEDDTYLTKIGKKFLKYIKNKKEDYMFVLELLEDISSKKLGEILLKYEGSKIKFPTIKEIS